MENGRCENVGIDPGEPVIGPVETADIVPEAGKCEPDDVGAGLQGDIPQDPDWGIKGDSLRQGDLHLR